MVLYPTLVENLKTIVCFYVFQKIIEELKNILNPVKELREKQQNGQSES